MLFLSKDSTLDCGTLQDIISFGQFISLNILGNHYYPYLFNLGF